MTQPHNHRSLAPVLVFALAAGCAGELELVDETARAIACPTHECGTNSPEALDSPLTELHLNPGQNTGQLNPWGIHVSSFIAPGGATGYVLRSQEGRFIASKPGSTLAGAALVGSKIIVTNTSTNQNIEVSIYAHETVANWTIESSPVDRYVLAFYHPGNQTYTPVCTDAGTDLGSPDAKAVLLTGERYTYETNDVVATGEAAGGWFTIACSGNALYKMKMAGYEANPRPGNRTTTSDARQATFKMLTGDYCGTGNSFTEDGTAVSWVNNGEWSSNGSMAGTVLEAYWGPDGALCLDLPRLGLAYRQAILDDCQAVSKSLPSCVTVPASYTWTLASPL